MYVITSFWGNNTSIVMTSIPAASFIEICFIWKRVSILRTIMSCHHVLNNIYNNICDVHTSCRCSVNWNHYTITPQLVDFLLESVSVCVCVSGYTFIILVKYAILRRDTQILMWNVKWLMDEYYISESSGKHDKKCKDGFQFSCSMWMSLQGQSFLGKEIKIFLELCHVTFFLILKTMENQENIPSWWTFVRFLSGCSG